MHNRYRRLKRGCYVYGLTTAVLINLSPVLFLTLREQYGLSYSALAALISANFITQLLVDLLFSFRPRLFDIPRLVRVAPLLAAAGFDPVYGARPLRRALQSKVEDPLAEQLLAGEYQKGDTIHIRVAEDRPVFEKG